MDNDGDMHAARWLCSRVCDVCIQDNSESVLCGTVLFLYEHDENPIKYLQQSKTRKQTLI